MDRWIAIGVCLMGFGAGCAEQHEAPKTEGRDLRLTILHTTDIHSRLLPYDMTVLAGDTDLGLLQENGPFGGIAKMAHIIKRERQRAHRSIYVDSGDCFQGAPIFNAFIGEAEQRALSQMRPDAVVIGNHEFDEGVTNYVKQLNKWATYPLVAANYLFEPGEPLGQIAKPVEIINRDGLKIGVIGVANFSSISSITDVGNSLHVIPLEIYSVIQAWIDILRPHVDVIIALSHAGLSEDEELIRATEGLDIIMGGHLHVVLNPPKVIQDKAGRDVILAHSGAFAKYVGRLDVVVRDGDVIAHDYQVFPIDSTVPEDPQMVELIEPYRFKLNQMIDLESVYGYASRLIRRFGFDGGDSPLGNLVAEGIRQYARADFGMTNSLGIRTDLNPGAITLDQLFNIFPFNNYVTTMYLSGADVQALLDFSTRRSAGRGCSTQIQVSGIEFVMDCRVADDDCVEDCPPRARDIFLTDCGDPTLLDKSECTRVPLKDNAVYEMATNDYIAQGGSGFTVLKVNNTQVITDVALRDAMLETVLLSPRCIEQCFDSDVLLTLERCIGYELCVGELSEFYSKRCVRAAETSLGETLTADFCALDLGGSCQAHNDCRLQTDCRPETCLACASTDSCEEDEACLDGYCRAIADVCFDGRCLRQCQSDADCPGGTLTLAAGQSLCIEGHCSPRQGTSCDTQNECIDVDLACASGDCNSCADDEQCASGTTCVRGSCVVIVAQCVDHRCRLQCDNTKDCLSGETCTGEGLCVPTLCEQQVDRETHCELSAQWRAMQRCLSVPCPSAEADGRIGRLLPENLADLPIDLFPDDDE